VASLRGQVRTVRYLVVACLALLVVLAVGLGVGLATSRAQLADLSAQVSALSAQAQSAQAAASAADPGQAGAAAQQPAGVEQLGAAPALAAGIEVPAGADASGAILIGDPSAANVVEVYVDYQCPYCQRWEQEIGSVLAARALQPGSDLLVKQYNLAFLGETDPSLSPAGASARAASAAACVIDADGVETFVAFNQALFASGDPAEPPTQFSADALSQLATEAGASADAIACIEAEGRVPFVAATTQAGFGRGVGGTPTVLVNGQTVANPFTDPALLALSGTS
jgi:protein-disulfide isomerase